MNPDVDTYLSEGCGRCSLGGTPSCKVHNWQKELKYLRTIALDCELTEQVKWGVPCYTFQNKNIVIIAAFKNYCTLSFLKGSLLNDGYNILEKPGENSQVGRIIRFTKIEEIITLEPILKSYLYQAIEVEKKGLKVAFKTITEYNIPEEFQTKLSTFPILKIAFNNLTPGRQRGYLLYFSAPKQSKTRESRIEKCIPDILGGKGLNDR
jgi:uncharacterized protein YdeI (YjbR/CyaY-like superfamily)